MANQIQNLVRSNKERMFAGVCGGLGQFFGIDPTIVRLIFVFSTLICPYVPLVYVVLMIVVPDEMSSSVLHNPPEN